MKLTALPIVFGVALATKPTYVKTIASVPTAAASGYNAAPSGHPWIAPGPNDFRGPCPMLNTLANHGFLPHDGKNITQNITINALGSALNFNESLATLMFQMATIANPEPNATFFTLDQLNVHNVLEHDASLSRSDAYFGNNHIFNETVFSETLKYWTAPILDANMIANSKVARQVTSRATNPNYTFTSRMNDFSLGEVIAPFVAFGDVQAAKVNRTLVEYWIRNERLPTELGWSKQTVAITLDTISHLVGIMTNATLLQTTGTPVVGKRADLHAGVGF
ncbi:Cloroperoxidase [Annulohypoxylon truncatum]|uniref:Cloroperoxidase n=1 Tax=Annulohypoxylon truncatum TaxID=327061 RepID=UPI002008EA5D|nr:Cloroperoxidase [Annulohypoxylon truncatum]KAI1204744.1 Cloroperoxidase [Annulohypoxylon truncatum]